MRYIPQQLIFDNELRMWLQRFSILTVILVVLIPSYDDVGCYATKISEDPTQFDLKQMFVFLRQGDKRLVRYNMPR